MNRFSTLVFGLVLATVAEGQPGADAQPDSVAPAASALSPVDYNFVAQANLGAPFQIDSGRIAEEKATSANIRDYAHLNGGEPYTRRWRSQLNPAAEANYRAARDVAARGL